MRRSIAVTRGPEYTVVRPKKANDLLKLLNEHAVDLGQSQPSRNVAPGVQSLYDFVQSGAASLVLKPQETGAESSSGSDEEEDEKEKECDLCLLSHKAYLHWQLGSKDVDHTLVNTHARAPGSVKRSPPLPVCDRLVDQPYEQVVSQFLGRFLDMDPGELAGKVGIIRVDYEKEFCKPSDTFAGVTNIFAFYSVYFNLNMPLPLNFGRPIVRTHKVPADHRTEELWHWRPSQLCGNPLRTVQPDLSAFEAHERQEDIQSIVEQALGLHEEGQKAVLRCLYCPYDSGRPVVLVLAVHRELLKTTQLVIATVLWDVTDEEVSEQSRAGEELRRALSAINRVSSGPRNHLAKQIGGSSNYYYDLSTHMGLVGFELPLACTDPPEVLSATLGQQLEVPFVLLRDVVAAAAAGRSDMALAATLAPTLEGLLTSLVAPGSVLGRLMTVPTRASIDIVEAYRLDSIASIMETTDPRFTKYNIFHKGTGGVIDELCKICGIEDGVRQQLSDKLQAIKALCNRLEKKSWNKNSWRPLCCMAHGNLTTRSVIVDALGSTWLYDWGTYSTEISWQGPGKHGGQQPLFRDLARLSARILFEGCKLPFSLRQAQQICSASWVDLSDLSRWFSIPKSVAYLFQRKMLETDFSKDATTITSKAQATRRVSKMIEQATAGPAAGVAESLQGRLAGREVDARRAFREAQCLGRAVMALPMLGLPEGLNAARSMHSDASESEGEVDTIGDANGPRGLAWKQQRALHVAAQASRQLALERYLNDPAWVQKIGSPDAVPKSSNVSLLPVDTSPLMLGLPLLDEVLVLLVGTSLDPWQKAWGCSFAADLATKLLPHLQALLGRDALPRTLSNELENEPKEDLGLIGMDVRFAKGHRLSAAGEPTKACSDLAWSFGSRQRSTDGTFAFRRDCQLTPEMLEKALLGWPCPVSGVPPAAVAEHRRRLGALPAGDTDLQKDDDFVEAVRGARRKNLWRRAAGALYEVESISLKPRKRTNKQRRVAAHSTVALALHEVNDSLTLSAEPGSVEELKILGHRLGVVGYVANAVQRCPHSSQHSDSTWAQLQSEYDTFPCTLCRQKVSASYPQEAYFAHCAECWLEQKRFTLCRDCASAEPPRCTAGHNTSRTEISPYDRSPSCGRCGAAVGGLDSAALAGEPHWFHCSSCHASNVRSPDVCRGCAVLYCSAGHELEWIASFKGMKSVCQSCGTSGKLKVYHCSECQEARCEVMYPTGLAAKADVKLGGRAGDVKVMAVAPGGAAAMAGVVPGHRLLAVNDTPPAVASGAIFDGVKDNAVLLEFIAVANFDVTLETAKALQEALVLETWHDEKGPRTYVTEVRSRALQQDGLDRGFRFLSANGVEAAEFAGDARGVLAAVTESCEAPYLLRFRQNGPKFLYHAGCGYLCDAGHNLEPHYVGTTSCQKGHVLQAHSLEELSEKCGTKLSCDDCGDAIFGPARHTDRCYACLECLLEGAEAAPVAEPGPVSTGRNYNVLCQTCTWKLYRQGSTESPYKNCGQVTCLACDRRDLGPDAPEDAMASFDARSFFHCEECWLAGAKYDICYLCALRQLQCTSGHELEPLLESPFAENLHCAVCLANLDAEEEAYHCRDCWWLRGARLDRCVSCAGQNQIRYTLDNDARMQVVPGNSPAGEITWRNPYEPVAHTTIRGPAGEVELEVRLKLHGLIYPMGTRLRLSSLFNDCEATITNLHETGKYVLSLDGDRKSLIFDPDLTNHIPAGVWRYFPGQKLVVCVEGLWRDFKVHTLSEYGSSHLLEEVGPRDPSKRARVQVELNSYNHSPAWLSAGEWWSELCRWEDHLVAGTLATDALTSQPTELLSLEWCLVDDRSLQEPPTGASTFGDGVFMHRSSLGPTPGELWDFLYRLTQKAPYREKGRFTAKEVVLVLGPVASGKTRLLQRLALEAIKAHDGEMVPFIVPAPRLLLVLSIATKVSNEVAQQKRHSRSSGKESEQLCLKRLADTDFLLIYIRMMFGASSRTTQFLRQALHSRRLLLLVDSLEQCPNPLQNPLLHALARLAVSGHRVVVAGSPSPDVFATFAAEKKPSEEEGSSSSEEEDEEASADELQEIREPTPERKVSNAGRRNSSANHRESTASIDFSALAERAAAVQRRTTQEIALQDPWWCSDEHEPLRKRQSKRVSADQLRKLWLAPLSAAHREDMAMRQLGVEAAQALLRDLEESDMLRDASNVVAVQSAPFFSLFLSRAERKKAEGKPRQRTETDMSEAPEEKTTAPRGGLLPALPTALPRQVSESKPPEPVMPCTGICSTMRGIINEACDILMASLADVRMSRKGVHGAPKVEGHVLEGGGEPLRKCLQLLALHAQQNSSDRVNEEDALYLIEYGGSSSIMRAFRELQQITAAGNFLLLRRHECWRTWEELVIYYVFPNTCIQGYLASLEIEEAWMKPLCPIGSVEEALEEPRWHSLLPFLAALLPGPLTMRFPMLTETKATLMTEFFARGPNVSYLNISGAGLGLRRAALRGVAAALRSDRHLLHLDVSSNSLGSEGVHTLCQALLEHPALLEFMLAKNHIGQVGAVKLVDLLRVNSTIQRIDLEDNPIGNEWANYIYVLQKDRTATLASAQEQALGPGLGAGRTRTNTAGIPTLAPIPAVEFSKELTRLGSVSSRLRHKASEDLFETAKSARTPRLLR